MKEKEIRLNEDDFAFDGREYHLTDAQVQQILQNQENIYDSGRTFLHLEMILSYLEISSLGNI